VPRAVRPWPRQGELGQDSHHSFAEQQHRSRQQAMGASGSAGIRGIPVSKQAVDEAFTALCNWGRWGADDQIGTLNHVTPEDVVAAAGLIRHGKVFALGIPLGASGPQRGLFGKRWNPIHTMLATGTDALAGRQQRLLYADDALNMPIQAATHWDALG